MDIPSVSEPNTIPLAVPDLFPGIKADPESFDGLTRNFKINLQYMINDTQYDVYRIIVLYLVKYKNKNINYM